MAKEWKVRATMKGAAGETTVKALISHPMETGRRKNKKTGKKYPAHFIQELNAEHNGKNVLNAIWGPAVSANPYLSFKFQGAGKGDKLKLSWTDNTGKSSATEVTIK